MKYVIRFNGEWLCSSVPVRRGQWASRGCDSNRGGVEKNGVAFAQANASRFFERSRLGDIIE